MATIDELKDEIRALQKENEPYKKQLGELLKQRNDELSVEKKQELADEIKSIRTMISENNDQILENKKQITADKQKEAADKQKEAADKQKEAADKEKDASKERQIAVDKEYRLKRVGLRISLRQLYSHLFGPFWRHTEYLSSSPPLRNTEALTYGTGQSSSRAGQSSSKQPNPDYTCSSTSSRALPSFRTDSSSTSPSSDSDYGLEMKARETQSRQSLEIKEKLNHSSLRHRMKDRGLGGAGGTG